MKSKGLPTFSKVEERVLRGVLELLLSLFFYSHINLNNGEKKNERVQVQKGQSAAKIYISQVVHHRTTVHPRSTSSLIQAAYNAGIHYSTAKTILFFHKKNYKNYSSYHVEDPHAEHQARSDAQRASYKSITIDLDEASRQKTQIQIIVNSKADQRDAPRKKYCPMKQKTNMFSD